LVYQALPGWGTPGLLAPKLAAAHFWLSLISVLGVWANGIMGYRIINRLSPGFYYKPDVEKLRIWLSIDGAFLTLFGIGCVLFLLVVFANVRYETGE
jgi:hypothetical protein